MAIAVSFAQGIVKDASVKNKSVDGTPEVSIDVTSSDFNATFASQSDFKGDTLAKGIEQATNLADTIPTPVDELPIEQDGPGQGPVAHKASTPQIWNESPIPDTPSAGVSEKHKPDTIRSLGIGGRATPPMELDKPIGFALNASSTLTGGDKMARHDPTANQNSPNSPLDAATSKQIPDPPLASGRNQPASNSTAPLTDGIEGNSKSDAIVLGKNANGQVEPPYKVHSTNPESLVPITGVAKSDEPRLRASDNLKHPVADVRAADKSTVLPAKSETTQPNMHEQKQPTPGTRNTEINGDPVIARLPKDTQGPLAQTSRKNDAPVKAYAGTVRNYLADGTLPPPNLPRDSTDPAEINAPTGSFEKVRHTEQNAPLAFAKPDAVKPDTFLPQKGGLVPVSEQPLFADKFLQSVSVAQTQELHIAAKLHGADTVPFAQNVVRQVALVALSSVQQGAVEVALDPVELGKVRMTVTQSEGAVSMNILVERPETLDLMRRHVEILEKELAAMGFDQVDLSFSSQDNTGANNPFSTDDFDSALADSQIVLHVPGQIAPKLQQDDRLDLRL